MAGPVDEHERTMAFAEMALGQIRSLRHEAIPRNYEVWYVYATGQNTALNKIVNETLARSNKLTSADIEQIYETYLSPTRATERIDRVGSKVVSEIDDVMDVITAALGLTDRFDRSLTGAAQQLPLATDREQLRAIIAHLVSSSRDIQAANKELESRLNGSKQEIANLQRNLEAIRTESMTDPLTGIGNRKFFDRAFSEAVHIASASRRPLALLIVDIDHFKSFNDNYGHLTGDQVLRLVGQSLKQMTKGQDIVARYGGEEFVVVLPNTELQDAVTVADHVRCAVMSRELKKKSTGEILGRVTISVGVSELQPGDDVDSLIGRADACLYAAKRGGRNQVVSGSGAEAILEAQVA